MRRYLPGAATTLGAVLLGSLLLWLSQLWVWPTPLAVAYNKGDLFNVHYGLPLPCISYDLGFDPPYPYPIRYMIPSPWEDPFEILWVYLSVDLVFWFVVGLLIIKLLGRTLRSASNSP